MLDSECCSGVCFIFLCEIYPCGFIGFFVSRVSICVEISVAVAASEGSRPLFVSCSKKQNKNLHHITHKDLCVSSFFFFISVSLCVCPPLFVRAESVSGGRASAQSLRFSLRRVLLILFYFFCIWSSVLHQRMWSAERIPAVSNRTICSLGPLRL